MMVMLVLRVAQAGARVLTRRRGRRHLGALGSLLGQVVHVGRAVGRGATKRTAALRELVRRSRAVALGRRTLVGVGEASDLG